MEQLFATVALTCDGDKLDTSVARLRALRHRTRSFVLRTYSAPGQVHVCARGQQEPLRAWREAGVISEGALTVVARSTFPAGYVDWSAVKTTGKDGLVVEVLITDKLSVLIHEQGGVRAELSLSGDRARHLGALEAVIESAGFDALDRGTLQQLKEASTTMALP